MFLNVFNPQQDIFRFITEKLCSLTLVCSRQHAQINRMFFPCLTASCQSLSGYFACVHSVIHSNTLCLGWGDVFCSITTNTLPHIRDYAVVLVWPHNSVHATVCFHIFAGLNWKHGAPWFNGDRGSGKKEERKVREAGWGQRLEMLFRLCVREKTEIHQSSLLVIYLLLSPH